MCTRNEGHGKNIPSEDKDSSEKNQSKNTPPSRKSPRKHTISEKWVAIFTGILVLVGCIQGWILYKTEKMSNLRDRANVFFVKTKFREYPPDSPEAWTIEFTIKNFENIPARQVIICYKLKFIQKTENGSPEKKDWFYTMEDREDAKFHFTVGPKQELTFQGGTVSIDEIKSVRNGSGYIYFMAEIKYIDNFNKNTIRSTQLYQRANVDKIYGHSFTNLDIHNCSDNDCND